MEKQTQTQRVSSSPAEGNPFTEEELRIAWNEFANNLTENKWLSSVMREISFSLSKDWKCKVLVKNHFLLTELTSLRTQILDSLKIKLKNPVIDISFEISDETLSKKAFTRAEKLKLMKEKNYSFEKMIKKFNLELD